MSKSPHTSHAPDREAEPAPVIRIARDGTVAAANLAARKLFLGRAFLGRSWIEVCPQMTSHRWASLLSSRIPVGSDAEIGHRRIHFTYVVPPRDGSVYAFGTDVGALAETERRLAEKTAQLAEVARFVEMNPGPVFRIDIEGIVLTANPSAKALFGADVIGRPWTELCPDLNEATWRRLCSTEETIVLPAAVGGRAFILTHRCDLTTRRVLVFGTDVTEQKVAEKALRHSEKMAMLGTLAAGITHELNNPAAATVRASEQLKEALAKLVIAHLRLTALDFSPEGRIAMEQLEREAQAHAAAPADLGPITRSDRELATEDWLRRKGVTEAMELAPPLVAQGLSPERLSELEAVFGSQAMPLVASWGASTYRVYSLLHEMSHSAARISEIVAAMKGYSYVGQAPVRTIDLHEGLDNTLVILSNKLKGKIAVERTYDRSIGPIVAYGGELNQVWTNLIDNAADALGRGGTITIRTARGDGWAVVEVEDDGPGIPAGCQSRIFDPFFTTKEPGKGTGLGLWVTYAIVTDRHKGEISFESRPGRTVFTVRLPLNGSAHHLRPTGQLPGGHRDRESGA